MKIIWREYLGLGGDRAVPPTWPVLIERQSAEIQDDGTIALVIEYQELS
jgi:hypothetical protein